jgi:3-deoxy-D-manno-octulosonate 8-phosphate phosphatase (KDO 8-P phosphatase)
MLSTEKLCSIKLAVFDFDGVFTDNAVYVSEAGIESVKCSRSDGLGLSRLKSIGVDTLIISTEKNPVVSVRANKMGIKCIQGVENKAETLNKLALDQSINLRSVMFLGNDINDISAFKLVGIPVAVADAYEEVTQYTIHMTECKGGMGAVREICDKIYFAHKNC